MMAPYGNNTKDEPKLNIELSTKEESDQVPAYPVLDDISRPPSLEASSSSNASTEDSHSNASTCMRNQTITLSPTGATGNQVYTIDIDQLQGSIQEFINAQVSQENCQIDDFKTVIPVSNEDQCNDETTQDVNGRSSENNTKGLDGEPGRTLQRINIHLAPHQTNIGSGETMDRIDPRLQESKQNSLFFQLRKFSRDHGDVERGQSSMFPEKRRLKCPKFSMCIDLMGIFITALLLIVIITCSKNYFASRDSDNSLTKNNPTVDRLEIINNPLSSLQDQRGINALESNQERLKQKLKGNDDEEEEGEGEEEDEDEEDEEDEDEDDDSSSEEDDDDEDDDEEEEEEEENEKEENEDIEIESTTVNKLDGADGEQVEIGQINSLNKSTDQLAKGTEETLFNNEEIKS